MIAPWMLYCTLCAAGLSIAAVLAERALLSGRGPVRHVWLGAVLLSLAVPVIAFRFAPRPVAAVALPADPSLVSDEASIAEALPVSDAAGKARLDVIAARPISPRPRRIDWGAMLARADEPLAIAWLTLSIALALHFVAGVFILSRTRRSWGSRTILGVPVLISERTGPALVGAVSPAIVVPEWALALNPEQLALMLRHEQEHRAAHDGRLLFAAQFALIAMPWNLALWWQLTRLRVAVELDCDARVLRDADARSYGDLLLEVVRPRRGLAPAGVTSFAERATHLERRIREMARPRRRAFRGSRLVAGFVALAAVTIAWVAPRPPAPAPAPTPDVPPVRQVVSPPDSGSVQATSSTVVAEAPTPVQTTSKPETVAASPAPTTMPSPDSAAAIRRMLDNVGGFRSAASGGDTVGGSTQTGEASSAAQPGDPIFSRLFDGITLSPEQEAAARAVIAKLMHDQNAIRDSLLPALQAYGARNNELRAQRDSSLMALLTSDADRDTLRARIAPAAGGRGGGGGGGVGGAGGRASATILPMTGTPVAAIGVLTGPGGRGGGGGGGVGSVGAGAARAGAIGLADPSQIVEATLLRLFNGIALTADQEASARGAISKMVTEQRALSPPRVPQLIALRPFDNTVVIEARSDSALMALITNDDDRQKLRARMVNPQPVPPGR